MRGNNVKKLILAFLVAVLGVLFLPMQAQSLSGFTEFARHPSIAAQPESGRAVQDLAIHNGELYMGFGNYSANTGPIDVATVNLATGGYDVKTTAATEEINTYRTFNGRLYAPWIDPTVVGGLYSSDQGGTWGTFGPDVENVHIFDVAVLPNGVQLAVGSANSTDRSTYLGATAFVSYDNGRTWRVEQTDLVSAQNPDVSGYERYYWIAMIGGKAYIQARDSYAVYGQAAFPIRVFDGNRWTSQRKSADCFSSEGHLVESFGGKAYCSNGTVFTGKRTTTSGGIFAQDFYQHNGVLYALSNGRIMRLEGQVWSQVATAPVDSHSLAVTDAHIYVGDRYGVVHRATI